METMQQSEQPVQESSGENREKLMAFLRRTGHINAHQAAEIAPSFAFRTLPRHAVLLQAGQVSNEYYFVTQGLLRSFAYDPGGHDITTGFFGEEQVAFEVASFFNRTPAPEYIEALTDCEGWCLTYTQSNELFHARQEFREFGRALLVQSFATLKDQMLAMVTETAAIRYERLLRTSPEILRSAPLKVVASYLGITDSSLSRIRKSCR